MPPGPPKKLVKIFHWCFISISTVRNGRNSRTHIVLCSLTDQGLTWLFAIGCETIRLKHATLLAKLKLMRTTRAEVQPDLNARVQLSCKRVQIQMRHFWENYLHEVWPNQIKTYLVKTCDQSQAYTQWSVMQQRNVSHSTVGIVAGRLRSQVEGWVSTVKCTASHCQRSIQSLLISHLLQFQRANIKNH